MKLVIQNTSRVWGGNEKWLATLATGLIDRGHSVTVSCASGPVQHELITRRIPTSPFRPRGSIDFVSGLTFAAWLGLERPDVLLLTSWRPTAWAAAAARLAGVDRMVVRLGIVRDFPGRTPRGIALEKIDALIVNSEEIRETWLATAPRFPPEKVHVILNGVRSRLAERSALSAMLRHEIGCASDTVLIGGAGHVAPRKGFDVLLRAFASAAVPGSRLVILGGGDHRQALETLARELGIAGSVTWLGHRLDGAGIIAGLDLFVLSSHNEGMANVMLEAMAGGTPVIASDISGVRRALRQAGERPAAGWIVAPGDADELATAIRAAAVALREDRQAVSQLAGEAHWRAENWFSPARMIDECEKILFGA